MLPRCRAHGFPPAGRARQGQACALFDPYPQPPVPRAPKPGTTVAHLPGPLAGLTITSRRGGRPAPRQQQAERSCAAACSAASAESSRRRGTRRRRRRGRSPPAPERGACQMVRWAPLAVAPTMSASGICSAGEGAPQPGALGVNRTERACYVRPWPHWKQQPAGATVDAPTAGRLVTAVLSGRTARGRRCAGT